MEYLQAAARRVVVGPQKFRQRCAFGPVAGGANHPRTGQVRDFKLSGRRSGAGAGIAAASFRRDDAGLRSPHLLLSVARARAYFAIAEIGVSDRLSAAGCAVVDGSQYPCRQL